MSPAIFKLLWLNLIGTIAFFSVQNFDLVIYTSSVVITIVFNNEILGSGLMSIGRAQ